MDPIFCIHRSSYPQWLEMKCGENNIRADDSCERMRVIAVRASRGRLENVGASWRRGTLMLESPHDFLLSPGSTLRPDRDFERSAGPPCNVTFPYELFNTGVFIAAMTTRPTPRSVEQPF